MATAADYPVIREVDVTVYLLGPDSSRPDDIITRCPSAGAIERGGASRRDDVVAAARTGRGYAIGQCRGICRGVPTAQVVGRGRRRGTIPTKRFADRGRSQRVGANRQVEEEVIDFEVGPQSIDDVGGERRRGRTNDSGLATDGDEARAARGAWHRDGERVSGLVGVQQNRLVAAGVDRRLHSGGVYGCAVAFRTKPLRANCVLEDAKITTRIASGTLHNCTVVCRRGTAGHPFPDTFTTVKISGVALHDDDQRTCCKRLQGGQVGHDIRRRQACRCRRCRRRPRAAAGHSQRAKDIGNWDVRLRQFLDLRSGCLDGCTALNHGHILGAVEAQRRRKLRDFYTIGHFGPLLHRPISRAIRLADPPVEQGVINQFFSRLRQQRRIALGSDRVERVRELPP